jgi:hypothetical protein
MVVVVPGEEVLEPRAFMERRGEATGIVGLVLERLGGGDIFPGAPPGAPAAALATFAGTDPNGAWRLFVVDDAGIDSGRIAGGWSLSLDTEFPVCVAPPAGDDGGASAIAAGL